MADVECDSSDALFMLCERTLLGGGPGGGGGSGIPGSHGAGDVSGARLLVGALATSIPPVEAALRAVGGCGTRSSVSVGIVKVLNELGARGITSILCCLAILGALAGAVGSDDLFFEVNAERFQRECCLSRLVLEEERSRREGGGGGAKVMAGPGTGELGATWFEDARVWLNLDEVPRVLRASILLWIAYSCGYMLAEVRCVEANELLAIAGENREVIAISCDGGGEYGGGGEGIEAARYTEFSVHTVK